MTASSKGGSPALVRQCLRDAMVDLPSLPAGPCREVDHGQNIPDIRNASDLFSAVVTTADPHGFAYLSATAPAGSTRHGGV